MTKQNKVKILFATLLLFVFLTSPIGYFLTPDGGSSKRIETSDKFNSDKPFLNDITQETWWNDSFSYRQLINITNPYSYKLINYTTSIEFEYTDLVSQGKMNSSLKDIRIIENNVLRDYYVQIDEPNKGKAIVWFKTNISAGPGTLEQDTYMYYGNNSVESKALDYNLAGNAWWNFNEAEGTNAGDHIEYHNGTLRNMDYTNWVNGKIGTALEFDGSNDYVALNYSYQSESLSSFTASAWVKIPDGAGGWAILDFDRSEFFDFSAGAAGYAVSTDVVEFDTTDSSGTTHDMGGTSDVADNTWHHIAVIFDSSATYDKKIYVDGELDAQASAHSGNPVGDPNEERWGFIGDGSEATSFDGSRNNQYYEGIIDELRYFEHALGAKEIEELYNYTQPLETVLNEEQARNAIIKINAVDLYGNYIPNVNISLYNGSLKEDPIRSAITDNEGSVTFINLDVTPITYNFTATIRSNVDHSIVKVINQTEDGILFEELFSEINLTCDISSHIFYIQDVDGKPVESGWMVFRNSSGTAIQNVSINENGEASFQWINSTPYYYDYKVYYQDSDYNPSKIMLYEDSITETAETLPEIYLTTNLTTLNFTVFNFNEKDQPIEHVNLRFFANGTQSDIIVDLSTDENGKATLRWLNSSGPSINGNYSLLCRFFEKDKPFNMTGIRNREATNIEPLNFTVSSAANNDIWMLVDPTDYATELIGLNPSETINAEWGTKLKLRSIFNVTAVGTGDEDKLGFTYADSISYTVFQGSTEILSGNMPKEVGNIGRHQGILNTSKLEAGQSYSVKINAEKAGFTSPDPLEYQLIISPISMILNQSENDNSEQETYWLENLNMTVKAYQKQAETFLIEENVFQDTEHNFDLLIPDVKNQWNLSSITFDIYNITWDGTDPGDINITITDPYGNFNMIHTSNYTDYGSSYKYNLLNPGEGEWTDITLSIDNVSILDNNNFDFIIGGSFVDAVDVVAYANFERNSVQSKYAKFNVTDSFSIDSFGYGWGMKTVEFKISNCFETSTWSAVNPESVNLEFITNENFSYAVSDGASVGLGELTIEDNIIYPIDGEFLFTVDNSSNIVFDLSISVYYTQEFYSHPFLENIELSKTSKDISNGGTFYIDPQDKGWKETSNVLDIKNIKSGGEFYSPSEVGMNITIDGITYQVEDVDDGIGQFFLSELTKEQVLSATIETNETVTFSLTISERYSRIRYEAIQGDVTYQIREAPDVNGDVSFVPEKGYYAQTIETSLLEADDYTVRFEITKTNYDLEEPLDLNIDINQRRTLLNGDSDYIIDIAETLYVKDAANFTLIYEDRVTGEKITDLDLQTYEWKKYDTNGNLVEEGEDLIISNEQNNYIIDFDTETLDSGSYILTGRLEKENYESRIARINLEIIKREFSTSLGSMFEDKQASIVKGESLKISVELIDESRDGIALTGAKVFLKIEGKSFEFTETSDGVYEYQLSTEEYEAFFSSNVLTGTIEISKEDYVSQTIDVTIVVEMEEGPIPGFPTFYSLIILIGAVVVVGSLLTYRGIQKARIPTFIKKARKMKGSIKSRKDISESVLYPSKKEFIAEDLGERWEDLGLSLSDVLGIGMKKGKKDVKKEGGVK